MARKITPDEIQTMFDSVKKLMEKGLPKYVACEKLGISRKTFHRILPIEQKILLDKISATFTNGNINRKY